MKLSDFPQQNVTDQFVYFASKLSTYFPDLDLRFNLQGGTNRLRYSIPSISKRVYELQLGHEHIENLVHEATFKIKEIAQRFDA